MKFYDFFLQITSQATFWNSLSQSMGKNRVDFSKKTEEFHKLHSLPILDHTELIHTRTNNSTCLEKSSVASFLVLRSKVKL